MYRAIPEVNRICSMADRARKYKQHQDALNKIKSRPKPRSKSALDKPMRPYSLHGKAQKEELMRINVENRKMYNAILYRSSTINRADFKEHEMDHAHQVSRMTQHPENYGNVPKENKKKNGPKSLVIPENNENTTQSQVLKSPVPQEVPKKQQAAKQVHKTQPQPIKPKKPLPKPDTQPPKEPTFETETAPEVVMTKDEEPAVKSHHSSKKSSKHNSSVGSGVVSPTSSGTTSGKQSEISSVSND